MTEDIQIRAFASSDRDSVRDLLTRTFGSSEIFDRYERPNPMGEPVRVVAEWNGTIVGYNAWNAWQVYTPQGPRVVHQSGASAVDSVCRGKGVFAKLLATGESVARAQGVDCFIGFPNPASYKSFLRAGWEHIQSLSLYATNPVVARMAPARLPRVDLAVETSPTRELGSSFERSFAAWRYGGSTARHLDFQASGRDCRVFYSQRSKRGLPQITVLDVIDLGTGLRAPYVLHGALRRLPWYSVVVLRTNGEATSGMFEVRRAWKTPLIVLPLSTHGHELRDLLAQTTFWYGDIDIA
jgi:predicted N-acetyltransferase YhbS